MTKDFADWLSPMLVKELRQGMRSKVLTTSLFLLQGLLILNVIAGFGANVSDSDLQTTTGFFWSILALPLLLILPAAAMGSIGNEIKANTLELIFLTRLTSRRIVTGKWIAVVAQAAILAVTVLPYVALRYYLGGVDVTRDLLAVVLMLVASALLTALTVALSSFQSKLLRVFMVIGFFFSLQFGAYLVAWLVLGPGGSVVKGGGWTDWNLIAGVALLVPLAIALMLEVGAARIAPVAENHAGPIRLLVLLIVLASGFTALRSTDAKWMLIVAEVVAAPFCIGALTENLPGVQSLYRPFVRRGFAGRLVAKVFTPGWHTGFLFTLLVLAVLVFFWSGSGWLASKFTAEPDQLRLLSLLGFSATLFFPASLISSSSRKRPFFYIGFIAISAGIFFFLAILSNMPGNRDLYQMGALLPPIAIFSPAFEDLDDALPEMLFWMFALNLISLLLLAWKCWTPFHEMSAKLKPAADVS